MPRRAATMIYQWTDLDLAPVPVLLCTSRLVPAHALRLLALDHDLAAALIPGQPVLNQRTFRDLPVLPEADLWDDLDRGL